VPIAIKYTRYFNTIPVVNAGVAIAPGLAYDPAIAAAAAAGSASATAAGHAATVSTDGEAAGWPTPSTVGVPSGTSLTTWPGGTTDLGPGTYDGYRFPDRISLSGAVTVSNIASFTNCHFEEGINNFVSGGGRRFYAEDCTFGMDDSCYPDFVLGAQDFDAVRCAVFGSDGVRWSQHDWDGGHRYSMTDCFVRSCAQAPAHGDGLQADGADGPLDLYNCTIDMRDTNSTACVFWGDFCTIPPGEDGAILDGCLFVGQEYFGTKMSQGERHIIRDCVYVGWDPGGHNDEAYNANIATWSNNRTGTMTGDYDVTVGDLLSA
jgi:hypothetical protein